MNKKSIPLWVIIVCIVGILAYVNIFWMFGINQFKYEVKTDGTISINKDKFTINSELKSYYDEESETFYVEGIFTNNTKKEYYDVMLKFSIYDLDGNILGTAYALLEQINENETWKFKAKYDDIDATDAVSYKLIDVSYY